MNADAKEWLRFALRDTDVARLTMDHGYYEDCIEHCQRAIEKSFKANLVNDDICPPKTHNLSDLAMRAGVYGEMTTEQKEICQELSLLYTRTRYPDDRRLTQLIGVEYCVAAMKLAKEMIRWTEKKLSAE